MPTRTGPTAPVATKSWSGASNPGPADGAPCSPPREPRSGAAATHAVATPSTTAIPSTAAAILVLIMVFLFLKVVSPLQMPAGPEKLSTSRSFSRTSRRAAWIRAFTVPSGAPVSAATSS